MSLRWPNKDPDEVLDYGLDWSARLNGDVIQSVAWSVAPAGLTVTPDGVSGTVARCVVSGGSLGESFAVLCRITTVSGRVMDQTVNLGIANK